MTLKAKITPGLTCNYAPSDGKCPQIRHILIWNNKERGSYSFTVQINCQTSNWAFLLFRTLVWGDYLSGYCDSYLGVQQCFGVVYHELTTLRQLYHCFNSWYTTTHDHDNTFLFKYFKEAKRSVGYHELTTLCALVSGSYWKVYYLYKCPLSSNPSADSLVLDTLWTLTPCITLLCTNLSSRDTAWFRVTQGPKSSLLCRYWFNQSTASVVVKQWSYCFMRQRWRFSGIWERKSWMILFHCKRLTNLKL